MVTRNIQAAVALNGLAMLRLWEYNRTVDSCASLCVSIKSYHGHTLCILLSLVSQYSHNYPDTIRHHMRAVYLGCHWLH